MANYRFVRLGAKGAPTFTGLLDAWRAECEALSEDFDSYSAIPVGIFQEIMEKDAAGTGLYVAQDENGAFGAVCMLNRARIPGYQGFVLRVRHILLSPKFDLGEWEIDDYVDVMTAMLAGVIWGSENDAKMKAKHIKFHARSPNDIQFLRAVGAAMLESGFFASVQGKGAWLYITKK